MQEGRILQVFWEILGEIMCVVKEGFTWFEVSILGSFAELSMFY
jgi:hypothetical protein